VGIPLLFTDSGGTPDLIIHPLSGLWLEDELYLDDGLFLDEAPGLQLFGAEAAVVAHGITITADPGVLTLQGAEASVVGGVDEIVVVAEPGQLFLQGAEATFTGLPTVVTADPGVLTLRAEVPQTEGGLLLILIPSVRELPPLRVSYEIETPGGRFYRWSPDEPNPSNVPSAERFSDTMPGGFETEDVTLPRKSNVDYSDLERFSTLTTYGAGGEVAWQGRLERAPRVSGDQMAVSPSAVGWQANLEDDKSAAEVYVDASLDGWGPPTSPRSLSQSGGGITLEGTEVVQGAGPTNAPALKLAITGTWGKDINGITLAVGAPGYRKSSEATYQFPDTSSGFGFLHFWSLLSQAGGPWNHIFWTDSAGDTAAPFEQSANFGAADTVAYWTPATRGNQFVSTRWYYNAHPAGAEGAEFTNHLRWLKVYGNHGLPIRGSEPAAGIYASDVVLHAVARWAPMLNASATTVRQSSFIISHLAFRDLTTAAEIVRQASRFELPFWGVWEGRTFHWDPTREPRKRWRARIGAAQLEETGPQADRLWNSIIVQYQDVDGSARTVGPPGSGADTEDVLLQDLDPDNPANRLGIRRRDLLTISTATPAAAVEIGRRFLEESRRLDGSGRARFVGHVEDDRGTLHPYWKVRAGDTVSFVDAADQSERRVVRTDKDPATKTCSVDLDAPPEALEVLLERLNADLVPLGV
jgi:hypothetical protein